MRSVYIVRCNDETLYTGIAKNLEKRIFDHNNSKVWAKYTKSRRPVKLIWHKNVRDRITASKLEYKLKRIGKEAKEKLVAKKIKKKSVKKSACKSPK
jgi:putative endonuclease